VPAGIGSRARPFSYRGRSLLSGQERSTELLRRTSRWHYQERPRDLGRLVIGRGHPPPPRREALLRKSEVEAMRRASAIPEAARRQAKELQDEATLEAALGWAATEE
jgi:hypothetical protein